MPVWFTTTFSPAYAAIGVSRDAGRQGRLRLIGLDPAARALPAGAVRIANPGLPTEPA